MKISDHKVKVPTGRGFTPRQYDFFSLFFDDENKENSTATWDYETETESINPDVVSESSNGKDIWDAVKDSLNYAEESKIGDQKTALNSSTNQPPLSNPSVESDDEEDDDEEISIFDFFLNGDKTLSTTTTESPMLVGFNITGQPLSNGVTNSPMHIEPILPAGMKNESIRFAMLPMSLYNMVKDDGTVLFDKKTSTETPKSTLHTAQVNEELNVAGAKQQNKTIVSEVVTEMMRTTPVNRVSSHSTQSTSQVNKIYPTSTIPLKHETTAKKNPVSTSTTAKSHTKSHLTSTASTPNFTAEVTTQKPTEKPIKVSTTTRKTTPHPTNAPKTMPTKLISSTDKPKIALNITTTTMKAAHEKLIEPTTTLSPKLVTKKTSSVRNSTSVHQMILTTKSSQIKATTAKINVIPLHSNPSILESDLNYDYSDPTLPPSLPNLKIIPFLPTDAVRNSIHKSDDYKSNYNSNYYLSNNNPHQPAHIEHSHPPPHIETDYSPFNVKPNDAHYSSSVADDRIDYDTYKIPSGDSAENLDYVSIYAGGSNGIHKPLSFNVNVNSKLDYDNGPSKLSSTTNKNITIKPALPPLPPFEPEHLYNLAPQHQLHSESSYVEYNVNEPSSNDAYPSEHNYHVPQFVTMPPIKEPARPNSQSVFSYKNKFIPPVKTEGKLQIIVLIRVVGC